MPRDVICNLMVQEPERLHPRRGRTPVELEIDDSLVPFLNPERTSRIAHRDVEFQHFAI